MKKILFVLLAIIVIMQFFRIDMENPAVVAENDFIAVTEPDEEVEAILRNACYDCHSNETVYPWYANVAPVSWWLKNHIDEGRGELNFSEWGTYKERRAHHKLEESIELVEKGKMPLSSYTWTHGDAVLSADQQELLIEFFNDIKDSIPENSIED